MAPVAARRRRGGDGVGDGQIDQLKDATVELIEEAFVYGDGWFISRRNALEGVVERHPLLSMQGAQGYRLLAFWRRPADVDAYEGL